MYKRILLKLSGEALSNQDATLDVKVLTDLLEEIKTIRDAGTKIGIVVGGGNVVRGKSFEKLGFERTQADKMGMLGTVMNALALFDAFRRLDCPVLLQSGLDVASPFINKLYSAQGA